MILKKILRRCSLFFNKGLSIAIKNYQYLDEDSKYLHILEAINYVRVAGNNGQIIPAVYFEFGCHSGRTFSSAINAFNCLGMVQAEAYAFDSFEGLPPTSSINDGIFEKGSFSTDVKNFKNIVRKNTGKILNNSNIIKGFYSESLTQSLQSKLPKAGIVHIDVDLYTSTKEVLSFVYPLLVSGTVILFDDWYCFPPDQSKGEMGAFNEFCLENPRFKVIPWKAYSSFGQSFFVVAI
ncbi:TylF/MycF/NovP-related O-methyltransferase [Polynucleobacter sp. AM-7D1]|uniref:TylF/MycF/NovP-related O-methyltransferase n=1 Tax=Polynucleobacter sp. AM-7D1 TaxID=2689102 RepID=UPI001BFECB25|nr:TylF/MycF/NovP-related O-methyltransferase [Polynucleobacter sp. AM-7D1]QWE28993.1 class I SAM-dependent methyltransferase [Polynucleobacter sp. AM-7D1]